METPTPALLDDVDATDSDAARTPERGQGMIEYAFILMLVVLVLFVTVQTIGHTTGNMYSNISNGLRH